MTLAIFWARQKAPAQVIGQRLTERFGYDLSPTPDEIRPTYTRIERAAGSVPQAIICALQSTSHEDAIRNAVSIGGDSDTIAAIAGGIAEALHGIPNAIAVEAWAYLPKKCRRYSLGCMRKCRTRGVLAADVLLPFADCAPNRKPRWCKRGESHFCTYSARLFAYPRPACCGVW